MTKEKSFKTFARIFYSFFKRHDSQDNGIHPTDTQQNRNEDYVKCFLQGVVKLTVLILSYNMLCVDILSVVILRVLYLVSFHLV